MAPPEEDDDEDDEDDDDGDDDLFMFNNLHMCTRSATAAIASHPCPFQQLPGQTGHNVARTNIPNSKVNFKVLIQD